MRVAVNTRFSGLPEAEGYAKFTNGLILNMSEDFAGDEFILMYDRQPNSVIRNRNVTQVVSGPRARYPLTWKWWYDVSMTRMAGRHRADVIFSPDGFCSLTSSIPQVLAIHDLAFLHFPEGINSIYRNYYKLFTPLFIKKAKHIVTVSEFSLQDIVKHYPQAKHKISVVYNDADEHFAPVDWKIRESLKDKHAEGREYFLYAGAIHPRKNLVTLLKGYSWFKKRHQTNMKLVLAGRMAWKNDEFMRLLATYKFRDDVILKGYVPQQDMFELMAAAYALVYPSHWEGFGLPVLEAMRSGVPVITSSDSAMQEVAGDAGIYVDPSDPEAWGRMMGLLYKDEGLRSECVSKGLLRSRIFSWKESAAQLHRILAEASGI